MVLPDPAGAARKVTGRSTPASSSANSRGLATTRPGISGAASLLDSSGMPAAAGRRRRAPLDGSGGGVVFRVLVDVASDPGWSATVIERPF